MLPLQASYDRGYETAAQEYAYMHEGFVQRQQVIYDNVCRETLNEVKAKFPAGMAANAARQPSIEATSANTLLIARQLGIEAAAVEIPLFASIEATAAEIPSFFSSEATAHLPFTIGGVVA